MAEKRLVTSVDRQMRLDAAVHLFRYAETCRECYEETAPEYWVYTSACNLLGVLYSIIESCPLEDRARLVSRIEEIDRQLTDDITQGVEDGRNPDAPQ